LAVSAYGAVRAVPHIGMEYACFEPTAIPAAAAPEYNRTNMHYLKTVFFINSINVTKDKVVVKRFSCLTNVTDKFTVTYIQCESKNWTLFI